MAYVADPTNAAKPADGDDASGGAAEFRALKAYLQTLLNNGSSIPVNGYAWQGFRNKIINGNFDVWQRGTSLGSAVNNAFLADRWANEGVGSTTVISRQAFALGQTAVPYEPTYFHRTVVTSVAGAGNNAKFRQRVESVRTLAGQTAILSFYAKADAVKNIAVEFVQNFGTGGAASAQVASIGVATKTLGTTFALYTVPVTLPSISGKTLGSNGDDFLEVGFWFDAGSNFNARTNSLGQQSGTFDIAQVQFEPGTNATPFELLPVEITKKLCHRFYQKSFEEEVFSGGTLVGAWDSYAQGTANFQASVMKLPVEMRKVPGVSFSAVNTGTANRIFNFTAVADVLPANGTNLGNLASRKQIQWFAGGNLVAGNEYAWHWALEAEL